LLIWPEILESLTQAGGKSREPFFLESENGTGMTTRPPLFEILQPAQLQKVEFAQTIEPN